MSKREMRCPHADKVSDCPECLAQLEAMSSTDPLREQIEPFVWYQPNTPEMDMGGNVTESDTLMVTIELDELMHLISQDRVERDTAAQTRLIERFTQLYLLKYGTWDDFTPRKIEWHHVMEVLNHSKDNSPVAELNKQRKAGDG